MAICPLMSRTDDKPCLREKCSFWDAGDSKAGDVPESIGCNVNVAMVGIGVLSEMLENAAAAAQKQQEFPGIDVK